MIKLRNMMFALFAFFLFLTMFIITPVMPQTAQAATLTVTNLNATGAGSLQQAVNDANSGDIIDFAVTGDITIPLGLAIPSPKNSRESARRGSRSIRCSSAMTSMQESLVSSAVTRLSTTSSEKTQSTSRSPDSLETEN